MVCRYGFSEKLGPMIYGSDQEEVFLGRDLGHAVIIPRRLPARSTRKPVASLMRATIRLFPCWKSIWISCMPWQNSL